MTNKNYKGFTLLEILLVVAAIAILAGIVIVAINPAKQLGDTGNAQRRVDVNSILNGVYQYSVDNAGVLPSVATGGPGYSMNSSGTNPLAATVTSPVCWVNSATTPTSAGAITATGSVNFTVTTVTGFSIGQGVTTAGATTQMFGFVTAVPDSTHLTVQITTAGTGTPTTILSGCDGINTTTSAGSILVATTGVNFTVGNSTGFFVGQTVTSYGATTQATGTVSAIPDSTHLTVDITVAGTGTATGFIGSVVDLSALTTNGKYLVAIPRETGTVNPASAGYTIVRDANNRITVASANAYISGSVTSATGISVTR